MRELKLNIRRGSRKDASVDAEAQEMTPIT